MDPRFHGSHQSEQMKAFPGDNNRHGRHPPMFGGASTEKGFMGFPNPLSLQNIPLPMLSTGQTFYTIESLEGVTSLHPLLQQSQASLERGGGEGPQEFNGNRPGGSSPRVRREMSPPPSHRHPQMRMQPPFGRESGFSRPPHEPGFGPPPRESGFSGLHEPGFGGGPRAMGFQGSHQPGFGGPREQGFGAPPPISRFSDPRELPPHIMPHPGHNPNPGLTRGGGGEYERGRGGRLSHDRDDFPNERMPKTERTERTERGGPERGGPERGGPVQKSKFGKDLKKRKFGDAKSENEHEGVAAPPPDGIGRRGGSGWCSVCKIDCKTPYVLEQHCAGKRHKKELEMLAGGGKEGEAQPERIGENAAQLEAYKQVDAPTVVDDDNDKDELDDAFARICEEMTGEVASVQNPKAKEEEVIEKASEPDGKSSTPVAKKRLKKVRDKPLKRSNTGLKSRAKEAKHEEEKKSLEKM